MATTADMRSGLILKIDNSLYTVIEFGQNKTARAAAKVWAKMKGVDNARTIEVTWNSGETIFPVRVEKKPYQYLYKDDTGYSFMDTETFEQITVPETMIDAPAFLKDGQEVSVLINGETDLPMGVELPDKIVLLVFEKNTLQQDGMMIIEHSKYTKLDHLTHFSFKKSYGGSIFSFFEIEKSSDEVIEDEDLFDSQEEE